MSRAKVPRYRTTALTRREVVQRHHREMSVEGAMSVVVDVRASVKSQS